MSDDTPQAQRTAMYTNKAMMHGKPVEIMVGASNYCYFYVPYLEQNRVTVYDNETLHHGLEIGTINLEGMTFSSHPDKAITINQLNDIARYMEQIIKGMPKYEPPATHTCPRGGEPVSVTVTQGSVKIQIGETTHFNVNL